MSTPEVGNRKMLKMGIEVDIMINEVQETTTFQCKLPKSFAERLRSIAVKRRLPVGDLVSETLLRFLDLVDTTDSNADALRALPDPPILDDSIVAPCDLPLSSPKTVSTDSVAELLPDSIDEV